MHDTKEAHRTMKLMCTQEALRLWDTFTENEKTAVRFGMFPREPMEEATKKGFDARMLSVAMMDVASKNGGMRA